jgi:hypothetical protein
MPLIPGRDDDPIAVPGGDGCDTGQDCIGVEVSIVRGWPASLANLGPVASRFSHRARGDRHEPEGNAQAIEPLDGLLAFATKSE